MLIKTVAVILVGYLSLSNSVDAISYRLPQEVKPLTYHIEIRPDFENHIFTGDVAIEVEAQQNANTITINQLRLIMPSKNEVQVIDIEFNTQVPIAAVGPGESPDQHFFVISLASALTIGKHYLVKIPNFSGTFKTSPSHGFYYAIYYDEQEGETKTFATTQFEPVGAREAFPCFDEPALKARFNMVIKRPSDKYMSVTNTPKDENLSSGLTDVFKETDLMSTYLVTIIVSEMTFSETLERHRVLAPSFELAQGSHTYALNKSYYVLNEMENYIEVPYTFEKLDHASIPHDYYDAGAMENWGLITYRDDVLLVTPNAPAPYKKQCLTIVAHEIGHQWFGNLVSPEWWEYVWLNEGFANYFEHYLPHKVQPDLDIWRQFTVQSGGSALQIDGYPAFTRPMNKPVEKPNDIIYLFDTIAYQKSGAVIRMLENVISSPVFRQGLVYYMQDRQFQGATPAHLYTSIQRAVDEHTLKVFPDSTTVADFMTTWDSVSGFPLVTVTRTYGSKTNNVHLKQRTFNNLNNQGDDGKWSVPINYATASNPSFEDTSPQVWLRNTQDTITVSGLEDTDWLIVNKQQQGYYRVNYDQRNWELLSNALNRNFRQIHPLSRAKLIEDCRYLANTGDISRTVCVNLETYAINEDDPIVWVVLLGGFAFLDNAFYYTKGRDHFKHYVTQLLDGEYRRLTFEETLNEQPNVKEIRGDILFWLCKMGHTECRTKSFNKFIAWKNGQETISADLQASVFCGAMRSGHQQEFDYLFNLLTKTQDFQFQTQVASGLSCMEDTISLQRTLQYALNKRSPALLKHIIKATYSSSKIGLETVLNFVVNNFTKMREMYGNQFREIIEELSRNLYVSQHLWKLKRLELLRENNVELKRAVATVSANVNWLNKNKEDLSKTY